jgi:AraC family transcriptional regulator, arabinose operon regulatory protein
MHEITHQFLQSNLDHLQVSIVVAAYTKCWDAWGEFDFIPDYNKLYFICEGEGWMKIGSKDYYPARDQLVLAPAGIRQSYSTINTNTYSKYWCHFKAKIGDINLFDLVNVPYLIDVSDRKKVINLFEKLVSSNDSNTLCSQFEEKAALMNILGYYFENSSADEVALVSSSSVSRMNDINKYIHENLCSSITVENLADTFHLHPNYFIKYFKKYTGTSPIQYINRARIDKAKLLLKSTGLSITEISDKTGFGDIYHFSKSFKSFTGYSPSDFRNI